MAGYVTKHVGHLYDGDSIAGQNLQNGMFVMTGGGYANLAPGGNLTFKVVEKSSLWGMPALVLEVISLGNVTAYFVENEWDVSPDAEWDESKYIIQRGTHMRIKRLLPGEQIIRTVSNSLYEQTVPDSHLMLQDLSADDFQLVLSMNQ